MGVSMSDDDRSLSPPADSSRGRFRSNSSERSRSPSPRRERSLSPRDRRGRRERSPSPRRDRSLSPRRERRERSSSPRRERSRSPRRGKPNRLFIGNLPRGNDTPSNRDIEDLFSSYGPIVSVTVKDGYGFIEFEREDDMRAAMDKDGSTFRRYQIRVQLSHATSGESGGQRRQPGSGNCFNCQKSGHWFVLVFFSNFIIFYFFSYFFSGCTKPEQKFDLDKVEIAVFILIW